jgi:hypothetical protein
MFMRILPEHFDNRYRGHKLAIWLFALLVVVKVVMSVNSIFIGHLVASQADGIPLDTFTPAGAQTVVALFAIRGLARFVICVIHSKQQAALGFFLTSKGPSGPGPISPKQQLAIKEGAGSFELMHVVPAEGYLHVSFYPRPNGSSFGGGYFGPATR